MVQDSSLLSVPPPQEESVVLQVSVVPRVSMVIYTTRLL